MWRRKPELSVAIVSRSLENLRGVYQGCLLAAPGVKKLEFLVSWNGRESAEVVRGVFAGRDCRVIEQPYHFARNNNVLAREAMAPRVLFVNDDVLLDQGAIDSALEELDAPDVGVVGINLRYPNGKIQHAGIYFTVDGSSYHRYKHLLPYTDPIVTRGLDVPCVTGAFVLMRTADFIQLGFDESFGGCGEDIDLCLRIRNVLKKRVRYLGEATGTHCEGASRKQMGQTGTLPGDRERIRHSHKQYGRASEDR